MDEWSLVGKRLNKLIGTKASGEEILQSISALLVLNKGCKAKHHDEVLNQVLQFSQQQDVRIKKMVYLYLTLICGLSPDVILHATNSIYNDLSDPNPLLRGNVLSSLSDIKSESSEQFLMTSVSECLKDRSAYVRCAAIDATIKNKLPLLDDIERVLQTDDDPSVVVRCLECKATTGQEIKPLIISLLQRLHLMDDSLKLVIIARANLSLDHLTEDEIFNLLNILEPLRQDLSNVMLCLESNSLMFKLSMNIKNIHKEVVHQTVTNLLSLFHKTDFHWKYVILCNIYTIVLQSKVTIGPLQNKLQMFLLMWGDPYFVKLIKLNILSEILSPEISDVVFRNITRHIFNNNCIVVKLVFSLLSKLHVNISSKCEKLLNNCIYSSNKLIIEHTVITLSQIILPQTSERRTEILSHLFQPLMGSIESCDSPEAQCALLYLFGMCDNILYTEQLCAILSEEIEKLDKSPSVVQQAIVTCLVQLFLKWPHVFEPNIKTMFTKVFSSTSHSLCKDQAKFYYCLLKTDLSFAKQLFFAESKITVPSDKVDKKQNVLSSISTITIIPSTNK